MFYMSPARARPAPGWKAATFHSYRLASLVRNNEIGTHDAGGPRYLQRALGTCCGSAVSRDRTGCLVLMFDMDRLRSKVKLASGHRLLPLEGNGGTKGLGGLVA